MADLHANKAAGEKELAEAVAKAESVREVCVSPMGGSKFFGIQFMNALLLRGMKLKIFTPYAI